VNFDPFFLALESSALSTWIRESPSLLALPGILTLHTLAMGFLAGTSLVIALRLLGVARAIPVSAMERFFPIVWLSFWINAVTGVLLLLAYPTKALTNPLFYIKLAIIAASLALIPRLRHIVVTGDGADEGRVSRKTALLAITSVVLWAAAITVGRLLPYTYHRLLVVE
jgi:hypothetical protein